MPQTSNGADGNPWIQYMRACAANYRAGHTQQHAVEGRPVAAEASLKPPVKRRITRKQPEPKVVDAGGKAKPQPITGQDQTKAAKKKAKVTKK